MAFLESESEVAPSCLTFCDPVDCSLPASSVHGIFQAIGFPGQLEWVAISFSRGSSQPRDLPNPLAFLTKVKVKPKFVEEGSWSVFIEYRIQGVGVKCTLAQASGHGGFV